MATKAMCSAVLSCSGYGDLSVLLPVTQTLSSTKSDKSPLFRVAWVYLSGYMHRLEFEVSL